MGTDERTRERGSEEVRRDSTRCGWYVIVIMISARESDLLATVCLGCTWLREVITQAAAFQAQAASPLGVATRIYLSSIHYTQCGAVHYLQKRRASFFLCKKTVNYDLASSIKRGTHQRAPDVKTQVACFYANRKYQLNYM